MPYRRRYKRRMRRGRRYKKRDTVKKVRRAVRVLQKQVETKDYTFFSGPNPVTLTIPANPTPYDFLQPGFKVDQGAEADEFIGREYWAKGIKIMLTINSQPQLINQQPDSVRVILLIAKNANAQEVTPIFNDSYDPESADGITVKNFWQQLRSSQNKNIKVLWDQVYAMGQNYTTGPTATAPMQRTIKKYFPLNFKVKMENQGGDDWMTGGRLRLYFLPLNGDDRVGIQFVTKFYYKDP